MRTKFTVIALIVGSLCSTGLFAADPPPVAEMATTRAYRGTLNLSLDLQGTFEPVDRFELRIKPREYHEDLIVKKAIASGSNVTKGQSLLELETDKIDRAIAAAENEANIASANLAKAQSDIKLGQQADDLALTNAKNEQGYADARLKRWDQIDGEIFLLAAGGEVRTADFYVEGSTDELDQLRKMYKSEDLTNATADIVIKRAVRTLEMQKATDKVAHANFEKTTQIEAPIQRQRLVAAAAQQAQSLAELQANQLHGKTIRQTSLNTTQAAADEANRKLADLKSDRALFAISSPIDGIAVYGNFDHKGWHEIDPHQLAAGGKIEPDHVMMTIYSPGKMQLFAQCSESQFALIKAGMKAKAFPIAAEGLTYEGTCDAPNQSLEFTVHLPAVDENLSPGFKADIQIEGGGVENVLLVPSSAVWHATVIVVPKPDATKVNEHDRISKSVAVGRSNGRLTEIKSGIDEGDEVYTNPKH